MIAKPGNGPGKGFWGRICHVDLGTGTILYEELASDLYENYLGGVTIHLRGGEGSVVLLLW